MNAKRRLAVFAIAALLSASAASAPMKPVDDPTVRVQGTGFSALPPSGTDWYVLRRSQHDVMFTKLSPDQFRTAPRKRDPHTFAAGVLVMNPEVRRVDMPQAFPEAVKEWLTAISTAGRFRLVSVNTAPYGSEGSFCAEYWFTQEERDNPYVKGKVLEITQRGFVCLDESMRFMVNAFQSERKAHGEPSMLDPSLQQEVDHFLKSVEVRPLSAASEGR